MPHVPSFRAVVEDAVTRWATESQQAARRNAMIASTAIAAQRKERADVEDFLAARAPEADRSTDRPRETPGGL